MLKGQCRHGSQLFKNKLHSNTLMKKTKIDDTWYMIQGSRAFGLLNRTNKKAYSTVKAQDNIR